MVHTCSLHFPSLLRGPGGRSSVTIDGRLSTFGQGRRCPVHYAIEEPAPGWGGHRASEVPDTQFSSHTPLPS